jgi:signal transduction histidine kinase
VDGAVLFAAGATSGAVVVAVAMTLSRRRDRARSDADVRSAEASLARERATAAQERATQMLVLTSMEEGVLLVDRSGARVFANEALARHLGFDPAGAGELRPDVLRQTVQRTGFTGAPAYVEVETGVPSRWLRASILPAGGDGSVLVVIDDVTEARHLDAVRTDFVANASHELKSPVAAIRAAAETLRDGAIDDPPAAARFTEQLEREAVRLSRIVTDLLDLSRLESGSERDERVHLDRVAIDEVERLADRAHDAGVTLRVHADGVPAIAGSARDLALLIGNLIENAIGYTPEGGTVEVEITAETERVLLSVRDTGIGIPGRDLPRIFERFYRVDRARSRQTGGTGLGLAIVKHVAENHGGSVEVRSELGAGTTFEVGLPRRLEPHDGP